MPSRRKKSTFQPTLPFSAVRNSGFLSGHWLEHRLKLEPEWKEFRQEAEEVLKKLLGIWEQQWNRVEHYDNEAALEQAFIQPIMQALGWTINYKPYLQRREPDYALFEDNAKLDAALRAGRKNADFWKYPTLLADAKAWHVSLDRPTRIGAKREYPPEQIEWYLNRSRLDYGILTNGKLCRLIPRDIGPGNPRFQTYLEVELPKLLDECVGRLTTDPVFDDFLRFYLLFNPRAFQTIHERPPLIERAIRGSSEYRVAVGEGLKERVFEGLRLCIEGFINFAPNNLTAHADLPKCREQSLILLYRLLFIMYAEDRGLLPYRLNRTYTNNRSLARHRDGIAERLDQVAYGRAKPYSKTDINIWQNLVDLFDLVDRGHGRYDVPAYNGGLFDSKQHPFLASKAVPDWYIAQVMDQLGRAEDPQRREAGLFRVDYQDLSIQHLGSIYEGLLELQPRYANVDMLVVRKKSGTKHTELTQPASRQPPPGFAVTNKRYPENSVYLETDKGERHSSGSYYTPDYIVDYIVENTLGPLCAEVDRRLQEEIAETQAKLKRSRGRNRTTWQEKLDQLRADFDDRILRLRVLDPAMGSGHFLLRACQYLAEEIATNPNTADPEADQIEGDEPTLTFWKRRVVESCIYGVDINPLAVELAKVALWLDTVSANEPLSFLDHHLRPGNSLVGGRLGELGALPDAPPIIQNAFKDQLEQRLPVLLRPLFDIRGMPSQTAQQIKEKERLYRRVFQPISEAFKSVADLWCSTFFAAPSVRVSPPQYEQAIESLRDSTKTRKLAKQPWFRKAAETARFRDVSCFHWELEFPEVFFDKFGRRGDEGFDAVIGNPPYLSYSGRQAVELSENERSYFSDNYRSAGWVTSHGLFIERAAKDLSQRFTAFIVPDQVGHLRGYEPVRQAIHRYSNLVEVRYWGEAVFKGVVTPALTFVADKTHRGKLTVCRPDGRRVDVAIRDGESWTASECRDLLRKLRKLGRSLGELVADPGVHTGNCSKKLILPGDTAEPGCVPVLEGKRVSRYRCDRPTKVMKLDYQPKPDEYFTIRPRNRYTDATFVIRQTAAYPIVGPRKHADYFRNSLLALYPPKDGTDVRYVVGILNSPLMRYVYSQMVCESQQKAFPQVKVRSLRELPIRTIDLANASAKHRHDQMVRLVQHMLALHSELSACKTAHQQAVIQRQISGIDRQIDQLVYQLYELTEQEVELVEQSTD